MTISKMQTVNNMSNNTAIVTGKQIAVPKLISDNQEIYKLNLSETVTN
jgi:hypothetical protein